MDLEYAITFQHVLDRYLVKMLIKKKKNYKSLIRI